MIRKILAPQVNVNETEATIIAWNEASGSHVTAAQTIAVLETNKAAQEIEAEEAGYLYYLKEIDTTISVGELLAVIASEPLSDEKVKEIFTPSLTVEEEVKQDCSFESRSAAQPSHYAISAKARKVMEKHGFRLEDFPAGYKISVDVVNAAIAARTRNETIPTAPHAESSQPKSTIVSAEPVAKGGVPGYLIELPTSKAKQQEVAALVASYHQLVPSEVTVSVSAEKFARRLDSLIKHHQFPFSLGDIACYGCGQLLAKFPELNGFFHEGRAYKHQGVNVGYALNFGKGLRVPVVRDADQKGLIDIANALRVYILKYSQDEIQNTDCSRGSFTITDLSSSGVLTFRPVIGPMQSAILGIGRDLDSQQIRLILAFDHRITDGLFAARFLNELKVFMEEEANEKGSSAGPIDDVNHRVPEAKRSAAPVNEHKEAQLRRLLLDFKENKLSYAEFRQLVRHVEESYAVYPLSEVQKGLWVMQKLAPSISAYNIPICFKWRGTLNSDRFQEATNLLLKQYPILTNVIFEEKGILVQTARPGMQLQIRVEAFAAQSQQSLRGHLKKLMKLPFVLEDGPLLRIHVLSRGVDEHVVLITMHHIISDGQSCGSLVTSLLENYRALTDGKKVPVTAASTVYRHFVEWERQWLDSASAINEDWKYWSQQLAGPLPECRLPTDRPRGTTSKFNGDSFIVPVSNEACKKAMSFAKQNGLKPSVVFLGIFKLLLCCLTGQMDLVVGMPVTGRPEERFRSVFGCFINMIAIRSILMMDQPVSLLFKQLQLTMVSGLYHGNFPFSLLVKKLEIERTERYSPVFQVAYMYHEWHQLSGVSKLMPVEIVDGLAQEGQYELTLEIHEREGSPVFHWKYDTDLFEAATITRMAGQFEKLMEELEANGNLPTVDYLSLVKEGESEHVADRGARREIIPDDKRIAIGASPEQVLTNEGQGVNREPANAIVTNLHFNKRILDASRPRAENAGLKEAIFSLWRTVLSVDSVNADMGFFQAGGNSVTSVLLVDKISKTFACEFTITLLFKYTTVNAMVGYLDEVLNAGSKDLRVEREKDAGRVEDESVDKAERKEADRPGASRLPEYYKDSVAIIGISCEFPGANDHREFWSNLINGVESAQFFSPEELRSRGVSEELIRNDKYVPVVSSMRGKDLFDAEFFNLSVRSAQLMDPQLRLLLMHSWRALEDAGYVAADIPETSVVMAANNSSYHASLYGGAEASGDSDTLVNYLMAQGGTIPTSISYYLGLTGPSIFIHTNCSSSLAALHSAYQGLRLGESKYALVGGASIYSASNIGYVHQAGLNLSSDGHCRAFDSSADGMTIGEGVGVVLVKNAVDAIEAGDHIYALLRGIGINNDGAAKAGFYAPSVTGQAALIVKVLDSSKVHPETIDFVEAHGTGTKLGDPIEVMALSNAYRTHTKEKQFCALSAVKPNIGHLDSAAGIAGVIKVALSLHHGELPPSINFLQPNPEIDFSESPFFVATEKRRLEKRSTPHRAALSSFGIGGTNAHAIFEEYGLGGTRTTDSASSNDKDIFIVPLSAKKAEALREYAKHVLTFLKSGGCPSVAALAFTLQTGRVAFAHRVAFVVRQIDELIESLEKFISGAESTVAHKYVSNVNATKGMQAWSDEADEDNAELIQQWMEKGRHSKLANVWAKGGCIKWQRLYRDSHPPRVSLPTYPFAKERYWVETSASIAPHNRVGQVLHPLLHRNTSDLNEQRFSSTFVGSESYLADHVVSGSKLLPGVAYLEMARAAVERSAGAPTVTKAVVLKNVVCSSPMVVTEPITVHIGLYSIDSGEIEFEIYTTGRADSNDGSDAVYAQGRAILSELAANANVEQVDLAIVQGWCSQVIEVEQCYATFRSMGLEYGVAHRGLTSMRVGKDSNGQPVVLARVRLPACVSETWDQYVLHPSVLDGALQASLGLSFIGADEPILAGSARVHFALPFTLEKLEINDRSPAEAWVVVRPSALCDMQSAAESLQKLDIDICDARGMVCVRAQGLAFRLSDEAEEVAGDTQPFTGMLTDSVADLRGEITLIPQWDVELIKDKHDWPGANSSVVVVGGTSQQLQAIERHYSNVRAITYCSTDDVESIAKNIECLGPVTHFIWIASSFGWQSTVDEAVLSEPHSGVLYCFRLCKALLRLGYDSQTLGLTVITEQAQRIYPEEPIDPTQACIQGLTGTLAKEYPQWHVRVIDVETQVEWPLKEMWRIPSDENGNVWAYRRGEWFRQHLLSCELTAPRTNMYRQGGVYVVIGGAGGIAEAFSEYLITAYQARMVWIGRRELDADIQGKLDRLSMLGPMPLYISADATDRAALESARRSIKVQYGEIHGLVHSAIGVLDISLSNMTLDHFMKVLSVKVTGTVRVAEVFCSEKLDFALFFSSLNSFAKESGKAGYSAGSMFQDAFALQLDSKSTYPVKVMNWGYWGDVGVGSMVPKTMKDRIALQGIGVIEAEQGFAALDRMLNGSVVQLAFLKVSHSKIDRTQDQISLAFEQSPSLVKDLSRQTERRLVMEASDGHSTEAANELQRLLSRLLFSQLQSLGLFVESEPSISTWRQQIKLPELYERWLDECMRVLASQGYVQMDQERCTVIDKRMLDRDALWSKWNERKNAWLKDENLSAQVRLLDAMMQALPEILTGQRRATDVMFPNSSMELVEGIYKQNKVADYFNAVMADTLVEIVEARRKQDPSARIRILEIGAGTGGTSAGVFARLKPYEGSIEEYCYTDISKAFLLHAQEQYGPTTPYLTYRLFNVEQPLKSQGIELGAYDVVIATNVLHATKQIRQTLRNTKAVLKRYGVLLLNEVSGNSLFAHLTFGLLEGWWLYEDTALRISGTPALAPESWHRALVGEGFDSVLFPARAAHGLGQQIVVAESDGMIRQARPLLRTAQAGKKLMDGIGSVGDKSGTIEKVAKFELLREQRDTKQRGDDHEKLRAHVISSLKRLVGQALHISMQELDENEPLEIYGIDSILVVKLTTLLKEFFANASNVLFFENRTIAALAVRLIELDMTAAARLAGSKYLEVNTSRKNNADWSRDSNSKPFRANAIPRTITRRDRRQALSATQTSAKSRDVAIIGLSGRYPQANNVHEYWENLKSGKDVISEIPGDRWSLNGFYEADIKKAIEIGKSYSKWGGFLEGFADFDPLFFNISPREAANIDPQERLFLQASWEVLEDAGYTKESLAKQYQGRVGVFAGITKTGFELHGPALWRQEEKAYPRTSFSSVANRVSYLLDLHGPSMPIDTMCSASLTAIHEAYEHLLRDECELAIAGGVNLYLHPSSYTNLCAVGMLSRDGECRSFGAGGNGFVPGEGVGAVLLKSLSKAIADQDHVYGVIKGTSINHGGKTNGYTVPNPTAQRELILAALTKAKIDPRTISYIEAHGTGTELGDPIEMAGLAQAFAHYTQERQFCAIGSVKSNIGHLESAAGIAGVTKVLLQMQHRKLVPSLHAQILNPHIDFSLTPFRVQQSFGEWLRPTIEVNGTKKEYPRIAGISSFGAGGANAHVIIEEYCDPQGDEPHVVCITPEHPALIVLSAKTAEQLREQAKQLLAHVVGHSYLERDLANIAYTLQLGREALEHRLAFVATTLKELKRKLVGYVESSTECNEGEECFRAEVRKHKEELAVFNSDEALQHAIATWVRRGEYSKLLNLWVKGLAFNWTQLYGEASEYAALQPRRISLPTYPFARVKYWIESHQQSAAAGGVSGVLHPLLQQNTSDFNKQRFSSLFNGEESYLRDHVVKGSKVLPGVCYLEMARAAVERSVGAGTCIGRIVKLQNVVWIQPVVVDAVQEVHIALSSADNSEIEFEVYTVDRDSRGEGREIIHAQGRAVLTDADSTEAPALIDVSVLRSQCDRSIDMARCYEAFSATGLEYGPAHRGIESMHVGADLEGQHFVLAEVKLPAGVSWTKNQYVLHPSVLDSALQASIGLALAASEAAEKDTTARPSLPFALERIEILERSPETALVYVRSSKTRNAASATTGRIQNLDIDICDEVGRVCVRLSGFTSRVLEAGGDQARAQMQHAGTQLLGRAWEAKALSQAGRNAEMEYGERWVCVEAIYKEYVPALQGRWPLVKWCILPEAELGVAERITVAGQQVFALVQSLLRGKPKLTVVMQVVIEADAEAGQLLSALSALLKSAQLENSKFVGQVIGVATTASVADVAQAVAENVSEVGMLDQEIRYVSGVRQAPSFRRLSASADTVATLSLLPWKDGGVYLITGGAGGLGRIFAHEIANRVRGARIILTGRSELSASKQTQLETLQRQVEGAEIEYRVLDVANAATVTMCVNALVEQYGALNGIIHSAGMIRDNFIHKKTVDEFTAVLAPKVCGTVNVDRATRAIELDFLILFSSVSGMFGNVGQSDYAMANAFMDSYAAYRNGVVRDKQCYGRTLSINWPLWASGGMRMDEATQIRLQRQGFDPMTSAEGIDALYRAWSSGESQVIVLSGDSQKLNRHVDRANLPREVAEVGKVAAVEIVSSAAEAGVAIDTFGFLEKVESALIFAISSQLKVKAEDIDVGTELSEFGFDSISLTTFGNTLNQTYGLELSPTIFFEYPTVHQFAEYLVKHHATLLEKKLAIRATKVALSGFPATVNVSGAPGSAHAFKRAHRGTHQFNAVKQTQEQAPSPELIAITGMSGCFPGANDVEAFWENLKSGKDCITEIPASRWDWQVVYGDPAHEANKTNIKWGGFIEGVDEFDPLFFGISPKEAVLMDPQQRLLMTYAWKAIEDAGCSTQSLSGSKTGIFVGTDSTGYSELIGQASVPIEGYSSTSVVTSIGPNRMSYFLNVHGPSEPIETACSSSLVAIHRAVRAMQTGDCEMALVGGINTIITPWGHISFSKAGMLCEDGRCKTFSNEANGYVRGEGVGMLFIKKLSAAERDGDHIYGLIRGSAENHGGRANSLTAPNPKAQAELIKSAYREAKIDPGTVTYIEAHGTGTSLGDPIEINGLKSAFADLHAEHEGGVQAKQHYCGLGSVKTNIGHLELAAGVAGVIKVLLQMKHKTLAPSLHCEEINPHIHLEESPFYVVRELQPWAANKDYSGRVLPRRAGVSSFGFGGANAHVIIEEYCDPRPAKFYDDAITAERPVLILLSAKNEERLREQVTQLLAHVVVHSYSNADLANIAYTLQVGRDAMEHRLAFAATTSCELQEKLTAWLTGKVEGDEIEQYYRGEVKKNKEALSIFRTDEDLQHSLAAWLAKGKYDKVLELWVKGLAFDWTKLYDLGPESDGIKPKRVSLPTYPFAREVYWIGRSESLQPEKIVKAKSKAASASAPSVDDPRWLKVTERWTASPLSTPEEAWPGVAQSKGAQRVLVLYRRPVDVEGIRKALAQIWAEHANKLLVDVVQLRELSPTEEARPLDEYLMTHRAPDVVFYFSGVIDSMLIDCELRCILQASQAFIERAGAKTVQFYYCYSSAELASCVYQEGLSGLFRAIALECPTHCYRAVEYPISASLQNYVAIVREWLQHPVGLVPAQLPMVCYRAGKRFLAALTELADIEPAEKPAQFRQGATYLMVGALCELGLFVCRALAKTYRPRLVILSRRSIDADVEQRLAGIVAAGSQVIYRSVDITDERRLTDVFQEIKAEIGAIDGVFQFANARSDGPLQSKSFASFRQTVAAKVEGTLNVDRITADEPLDFFMVHSSMAAFGIEGSADYGYATAFQNAFVRDRNRKIEQRERTGRSLAFCWGAWAVEYHLDEKRYARTKQFGFDVIPETSILPLMEAGLRERSDVVGIMAVTDRQRAKQLFGLPKSSDAPITTTQAKTEHVSKYDPLEKDLLKLCLEGNGSLDSVKKVLLKHSHVHLIQLRESLTDII